MTLTYQILRDTKISLQGLVEEADVEARHDVHKAKVDILQRLGLCLQGRHQLGLGVENLSWQKGLTYGLQHEAPSGWICAVVGRAEEDDAVGRHEDGPQAQRVGIGEGGAIV